MSSQRVIHPADLPWERDSAGAYFAHRRRRLSHAAGGDALGCTMVEVDPGKTAMPFHYHCGNEEALYVLHGSGTLRLGEERVAVEAGDYVAFVAGPDHAHQLTNTGTEPLRYLMLSTRHRPDVVVYPDSDKVGVLRGSSEETFFVRRAAVDRWDGEPIGKVDAPGRDPDEKSRAAEAAAADKQREREIDEEIERMKRRLADDPPAQAERKNRASDPHPPPAADDRVEDLDALKRKLDGE
jgi:uncharacterized cupin superfamily protein